jgi:hypothetical protein
LKKHGFITNGETNKKTLIKFKIENGEVFISCGISLAIMNGITKPTQIELHYEYYGNNFLLYSLDHLYNNVPINKDDDEESTESDQHAEELLQEICNFA